MVLLLDCLKRRENWPEEFITALEECNHSAIAAEVRNEYNALKGSKSDVRFNGGHFHWFKRSYSSQSCGPLLIKQIIM